MTALGRHVQEFFRRPYGTGAPLNVYMFLPTRLLQHAKTAVSDPRYFISRLRVMAYQLRHPGEPWLTQDALRAIKGYIARDMRAFEWGSGKSTVWLARHCRTVVSVEHDPQWYERVKTMLGGHDTENAEIRLADGASYAEQISRFPDASFDFVLVDGAERNACIRAAAPKLRPGGWMVVDNAEARFDYSTLHGYRRVVTRNGVWQTDIFVKPTDQRQ